MPRWVGPPETAVHCGTTFIFDQETQKSLKNGINIFCYHEGHYFGLTYLLQMAICTMINRIKIQVSYKKAAIIDEK